MRRISRGRRTERPTSSVTTRYPVSGAVCAKAWGTVAACARAQKNRAATSATRTGWTRIPSNTYLPWRKSDCAGNEKSPTRLDGAFGTVLSREEQSALRRGRVAWLTALQPITVAGPRPILTAFPASLACKLSIECRAARQAVSIQRDPRHVMASDSSSSACAFRPARGALPENLRAYRARSRKCSSSASGRHAGKVPCRRELPFWPW